jgi:hypothetical protein
LVQQPIAEQVEYGVVTVESTLIGASQGAALRAISLLDRDVFTVAVPEDSEVDSIEDLKGGALGITEFGGGEVPLVNEVLDDAALELLLPSPYHRCRDRDGRRRRPDGIAVAGRAQVADSSKAHPTVLDAGRSSRAEDSDEPCPGRGIVAEFVGASEGMGVLTKMFFSS